MATVVSLKANIAIKKCKAFNSLMVLKKIWKTKTFLHQDKSKLPDKWSVIGSSFVSLQFGFCGLGRQKEKGQLPRAELFNLLGHTYLQSAATLRSHTYPNRKAAAILFTRTRGDPAKCQRADIFWPRHEPALELQSQ